MAGTPDWFDVTNLEVVAPGAGSGAPMKGAIQLGIGGDPFDLWATFKATNVDQAGNPTWWALAELLGGANPQLLPNTVTRFFFESIGPGPEPIAGPDVLLPLQIGGNGGGAFPGISIYQAQLAVPNADAVFVDGAGNPAPGSYRVQCRVDWDIVGTPLFFASATFSGDLIVRVALNV